jgi:hypothetical protein
VDKNGQDAVEQGVFAGVGVNATFVVNAVVIARR